MSLYIVGLYKIDFTGRISSCENVLKSVFDSVMYLVHLSYLRANFPVKSDIF